MKSWNGVGILISGHCERVGGGKGEGRKGEGRKVLGMQLQKHAERVGLR
jgi:hypothetical protein